MIFNTVHPRFSEQVEIIFLLGCSDLPKIWIMEYQDLPTNLAMKRLLSPRIVKECSNRMKLKSFANRSTNSKARLPFLFANGTIWVIVNKNEKK